jgi:ubiquinone/menaquinone biosynthesis C-methylase UbiE
MNERRDPSAGESSQQPFAACFHPRFAAFYERFARSGQQRRLLDPLREKTAGEAFGVVLEVGAGTGLNFSWYQPTRVERVEAIEPDSAMLAHARLSARSAPVPIVLTQASVEALPFAESTFDSAVVTLVLCSIHDPARALAEIKRVLKPQGTLLVFEHVRSQHRALAQVQDALVPVTTRLFGNCHWNRDAARAVSEAGFAVTQVQPHPGGFPLLPHLLLQARRL